MMDRLGFVVNLNSLDPHPSSTLLLESSLSPDLRQNHKWDMGYTSISWAGEMAQQVKVPAAKAEDLRSILRTYTKEEWN